MINVVLQLAKLHRYERRARSRCMRAMRDFLAYKEMKQSEIDAFLASPVTTLTGSPEERLEQIINQKMIEASAITGIPLVGTDFAFRPESFAEAVMRAMAAQSANGHSQPAKAHH